MRRRSVVLVAVSALLAGAPSSASTAPPAPLRLTVDVAHAVGPINRDLVGFGWHEGGAPLDAVAALEPHLVRIDASLEQVSTGPDEPLHFDALLSRVAAVRGVGAEPLVILSYLPAWLGEPFALGRDPTRVAPSDFDAWQRVVHDVVLALATAPSPALRFEAWNEPDIPLFWLDTPTAWVDTVERSARAVAAVERETGLDLQFGGPATFVPDPAYLVPFVARLRDPALPLDFVSWHFYGNYPFIGPDGAEFPATEPIQPVLGQPNPLTSPAIFGQQVEFMRTLTATALAGSGRAVPRLLLDEWNLSAAGFDERHDTATGAAFAAGVLVEFQESGLDESAFFRANDTRGVPGEHGAVTVRGEPKPVWWSFALWQRLAPTQVALTRTEGVPEDLWAVASADTDRVTILVVRFRAASEDEPRVVELELTGRPVTGARATVRRIDADHSDAVDAAEVPFNGSTISFDLPSPGVALVELTRPDQRPVAQPVALPATR